MNRRSLLPELAPARPPSRWRRLVARPARRLWAEIFGTSAGALLLLLLFSGLVISAILRY
ncbi:hypothetical protein FAZ78_23955 [Cereibacter changlensis]|uniref:Uncharacterized protein n=1 Tax=Cereibacter changlensis TaxID=402884 RepID=A0A4U0YYF6_9RHOB|nr:hypothetical protein [Cereibacter changlensis]TKA94143.1 hypothetical protein FAZ78_23955 [Cereibacter changlensis]